MSTMRTLLPALLLPLALTACGGDTEAAAPEPTPTPTETTATVSQFASVFAEFDVPAALSEIERNCGVFMEHAKEPICNANVLTLEYTATGLAGQLRELGEPPAEIADLVARTTTAADGLVVAAERAKRDPMGVVRARMDFPGDAWKPYL